MFTFRILYSLLCSFCHRTISFLVFAIEKTCLYPQQERQWKTRLEVAAGLSRNLEQWSSSGASRFPPEEGQWGTPPPTHTHPDTHPRRPCPPKKAFSKAIETVANCFYKLMAYCLSQNNQFLAETFWVEIYEHLHSILLLASHWKRENSWVSTHREQLKAYSCGLVWG